MASLSHLEAHTQPTDLIYRIDSEDRICFVNDAWTHSAQTHGGEVMMPERILGKLLWDFFQAEEVKEIYQRIVGRARRGRTVKFNYRCDLPHARRFYVMTIRPRPNDSVDFISVLEREEPRKPVHLFDHEAKLGEGHRELSMCSWCQRIRLPVEHWLPLEEVLLLVNLMEGDRLPVLKYSVCHSCDRMIDLSLRDT